jgi:hypothetical protein
MSEGDDRIEQLREAMGRRAAEARAACDEAMRLTGTVDPAQRSIAETHGPGLVALLSGPTKDLLRTAAATEFTPADFEFATVPSHRIADVKLQRYVQKLKTNTQNERAVAAALLNEALDAIAAPAVPEPAAVATPQAVEPEPVPEPAAEVAPEPAPELVPESMLEPVLEPTAEAVPEPPELAPLTPPRPIPDPFAWWVAAGAAWLTATDPFDTFRTRR